MSMLRRLEYPLADPCCESESGNSNMNVWSCSRYRPSRRCPQWRRWGLVLLACLPFAAVSEVAQFPFEIPWDGWLPPEMDIGAVVLDKPAGKHGRLLAEGNRLVFEDGVSPRFWGVGLTFSSGKHTAFPPDKDVAQKVVRKLSQYGFNHVRLVGLDGSAPEIVDTWLKTGSVDCPTLDKLDYFVSLLRQEGIYYSFSINNHAARALSGLRDLPEVGYGPRFARYKHVRLLDDAAISLQADWYRAFFGHINRYTGLSYAQDPANIYVSAVNEDSASLAYFDHYDRLGEAARRLLERRFRQFVQTGRVDSLASTDSERQSASLPSPARLRFLDRARKRQVAEFLLQSDRHVALELRKALRAVGYDGLFTFNNNWAGYAGLLANYQVGDYIEMHSYFDHPKRSEQQDKVSARSLIEELYPADLPGSGIERDFGNPFNRLFMGVLSDRPVVVSEWNHNAWSRFPYEGPLLMSAYSALQGIQLLDSHTFFVHPNPDPKNQVPTEAFAVGSNPVWMALYPSLSVAFVKGYLSGALNTCVWTESGSLADFLDEAATIGMRNTQMNRAIPLDAGYWYKLRKTLVADNSPAACNLSERGKEAVATDTGAIVWSRATGGANFRVITDRFVALAGHAREAAFDLGAVAVKLDDAGAITAVALDDQPLDVSKVILVTSVAGYQNTGWDRRRQNDHYTVSRSGRAPVLLRVPHGEVEIGRQWSPGLKVYAATFSGLTDITDVMRRRDRGDGRMSLRLGEYASPWYLVVDRSVAQQQG